MPIYETLDSYNYIGKRGLKRKDGYEKASGTGLYTRDIILPGMLYAKPFLSPYAHAKIKSLDTSDVEAYPGVRYVLRYDDPVWAEIGWQKRAPFWMWGAQYEDLLGQTANFAGEMMGFAVCADTEQICDEAMKLAKIEWDVLPFYIDAEEAAAPGATILEPDVDPETNVRLIGNGGFEGNEIIGDVEQGFEESDNVVEFKWSEIETNHAGAEALSCTAVCRGEFTELWVHNQVPMRTQMELARYFGSYVKLHVHCMYQGAQFGMANWLNFYKIFPIVSVVLAKKTRKPVQLLYDDSYWQHRGYEQGVYYMKVGFNDDGTIIACQNDSIPAISEFNAKMVKGTSVKHYKGTNIVPYFNRPACVCYRHGMRSCGMWNMIYGHVAAELGMDPTEVAIKNDGYHGHDMNWVLENVKRPLGFPEVDSLKNIIQIGKEKFDWDDKYHAPGGRILPNGRYHGVGFISSIAWSPDPNMYLSYYQLCVNVQRGDGKVRILARHGDGGWNHESAMCRVLADELGAKYDDIEFRQFDDSGFDTAAGEGSAGGIRTLPMLVAAARKVKQQILEKVTSVGSGGCEPQFPGLTPADLDVKESVVFEIANPDNKKTLAEVANYQYAQYQGLIAVAAREQHNFDIVYMGRQCTFVEIEVDPETGEIIINDVCNVNDVGKAVDPDGINAQQYGGSTMGLSHNRQDGCIYDPATGVKLNNNLIDYKWFSFNDIKGPFSPNFVENGFGYGPYGYIGCSESLAAVNSTTLNLALYNAIGKWVTDNPLTPDKVLKALGKI